MCSLVTQSCCISLETRLVLNSEYIGPFYFFSVLFDIINPDFKS